MKFYFPCPNCKKNLRADTANIGAIGTCSMCNEKMTIPDPNGGKKEPMALAQTPPQTTQQPPQSFVTMQAEPLMGSIAAIAASNVRDILKSSLDHIDQHTLRKNIHNYETSDLAYLSNQFLAAQFGLTEAQRQNMLPFPPRGNTVTLVNTQQSVSPQPPQAQPQTPQTPSGTTGEVTPTPPSNGGTGETGGTGGTTGPTGGGGGSQPGGGGQQPGGGAIPCDPATGAGGAVPTPASWRSKLLPWIVAGTMGAGAAGSGAVLNHYLENSNSTEGIPAGVGWEAES